MDTTDECPLLNIRVDLLFVRGTIKHASVYNVNAGKGPGHVVELAGSTSLCVNLCHFLRLTTPSITKLISGRSDVKCGLNVIDRSYEHLAQQTLELNHVTNLDTVHLFVEHPTLKHIILCINDREQSFVVFENRNGLFEGINVLDSCCD